MVPMLHMVPMAHMVPKAPMPHDSYGSHGSYHSHRSNDSYGSFAMPRVASAGIAKQHQYRYECHQLSLLIIAPASEAN